MPKLSLGLDLAARPIGNLIPWTPSRIPTIFWYDASDLATITATSSETTQVLDKSGNNYTLTRASGQVGPNTGTRTLNGLNVLEWTGNNCLQNTAFTYDQAATRLYIAMVFQVDSTILQHFFLAGRTTTATGTRLSARWTTANNLEIIGGSNTGVNQQMGTAIALTRGQPYLTIPKFNGSTSAWRVNGTQTNTGNIGTNSFTILQLGHNETEASDLDGYIAEAVAFSNAASQEIVEGYLAWKWSLVEHLPADHRFKTSAPYV